MKGKSFVHFFPTNLSACKDGLHKFEVLSHVFKVLPLFQIKKYLKKIINCENK